MAKLQEREGIYAQKQRNRIFRKLELLSLLIIRHSIFEFNVKIEIRYNQKIEKKNNNKIIL